MQTEMIYDDEQIEIFDFYSAVSYNFGVNVLNCGNNDTPPLEGFMLVTEADLIRISLRKSEKYQKNRILQ